MEDRALAFLRRLLDAPGPSGYESAPARVWREEAATFADEVTHDVVGSSFARVKPRDNAPDAPKVLLAGHIDEIGFVITHIDTGRFPLVLPARRLGRPGRGRTTPPHSGTSTATSSASSARRPPIS